MSFVRALRVCSEGARAIEDDEKIDETANKHKQSNKSLTNKLKTTISVKNFTKLLMAVVLFASYSCVQDTTEDLAPTITGPGSESGEVATLRVSLPTPSRTELGEKDADGKYPVYWCEEDVLAVNGKPTTKITIDESDRSVAVFDLPLGITIPYHLVYPYQGEGVEVNTESGKYPVVFASEQMHTEGSFAQGSAPMYGWSNGFEDIRMHHLATALRFRIKAKEGESVDLKYVSVSTVAAEPISGVFDVYCGSSDANDPLTGTIEPRESAVSTVFYNFENDSHILTSDKESVFYITVPKGEYTRFEVNFVNQNGEVCVETFDASADKKLEGGKVREFPLVEFEKNSKMFLIGNDADMLSFAQQVVAGTFNANYDGALLVSDIDMTDKAWTSVEGFTSVFEGRNYSIKGLTTPLFGNNIVGTISNVKVEANIVEAAVGKVGVIARSLAVDGDKVGTIFNCSAEGSIVYANSALAVTSEFDSVNIGGLVGGVYGGSVTLSESGVNITVQTAGPANFSGDYTPCVGGVVGYAAAAGSVVPAIVENSNNGTIVWDDNSKSAKVTPYIGGVAGYVTAGSFTDNVNSGELYINEAMYDLDWGGVIGASAVKVERCENKGSLSINEAITKANIGGVLGKLEAESILDCENSGQLHFQENFLINNTCVIGGVVAMAERGTKSIANCYNSGAIEYVGSCYYAGRSSVSGNANMILGGVVGFALSELVLECHNASTAILNIEGKVSGNGNIATATRAPIEKMTAIGAVIGARGGSKALLGTADLVNTENCTNKGNVKFSWQFCGQPYIFSSACIGVFESDKAVACKNEGTVLVESRVSSDAEENETTGTVTTFAAGLFGCISANTDHIYDCENAGSVTVDNSHARLMWISGVLGTAVSNVNIKMTRCGNTGNLTVGENVSVTRAIYVGGILSNTLNIKLQYPECFNTGTVESKATAMEETYLGSILGRSTKSDDGKGAEGVKNSGRVIYSGKSYIAYVGGYCGRYEEEKHSVQFENTSSGTVEFIGTADHAAYVGGIGGLTGTAATDRKNNTLWGAAAFLGTLTGFAGGDFTRGMVNNGNVSITGYAPNVYVSGGFGAVCITANTNGISNIVNNGTITIPANVDDTKIPTTIHMGGAFGYITTNAAYPTSKGSAHAKALVKNCHNTGDILYYGIARDGAYIGGLVGRAEKAPISECSNSGAITSTGHAGNASPKLTQSLDKNQHEGWAFNYKNHDLAIGGLVGETDLDILNSENTGAVTHTCTLNPLKIDHNGDLSTSRFDIGGIAGRTFVPYRVLTATYAFTLANLTNSGAVTIYGAPSATNNTPSIDLADDGRWQWSDIDDADRTNMRIFYRVNSGGLVGRLMDNSSAHVKHYIENCTNTAAVSTPEAAGAKCYSTAGIVGELLTSYAEFNGVKNTGRVSIEKAGVGTTIDGALYISTFFINMGGMVGTFFDTRNFQGLTANFLAQAIFNDCQNDGDIHYGETAASIYQCAGGMMGQVLHFVRDRCVGSNNAPEGETYTGSGTRYSSADVKFYRCKNNGNISYRSSAMNLSQGYNYNYAGGILGSGSLGLNSVKGTFSAVDLLFDHCENAGEVQFDRNNSLMSTNASPAYTSVGGILGWYCGTVGHATSAASHSGSGRGTITPATSFNAQIISCKNSGRIWGYSGYLGGIVGTGNWFVKVTGTEADPTINTGDIVVKRENGEVVTKNWYGNKYIYAGGIAGAMIEMVNATYAVANADGNPAWPAYKPSDQYTRVEYAVNEGAVGATGMAGGIVGYYYSAVEAAKELENKESRGGMEFCRNTGDIYALEGATTNVGAMTGYYRMLSYTANSGNTLAEGLSEKPWQIGVRNCQIGGTVLRGAINKIVADKTNYMQIIYGENWSDEFISIFDDKIYDGCTLYEPVVEETPGEEGEEGTDPEARR